MDFATGLAAASFLLSLAALRSVRRIGRSLGSLSASFKDVHTQLLDAHVITRVGGLRNLPQGGEEGTDPETPKG